MKKSMIFFIIVVILIIYSFLQFHFILTKQGFLVRVKSDLTLEDTFVDTRNWTMVDYLKHRRISIALLKGNKSITKDLKKKLKKNMDQLENKIKNEWNFLKDF